MNDKCAGGTGAVIDKINAKLKIPADELCDQGYLGIKLHKVAGKCGVFAETDINGLQKEGTPPDELMASLFDAIVLQNLTVLTRGHTLRPHVLLLGGPEHVHPRHARSVAAQHPEDVGGARRRDSRRRRRRNRCIKVPANAQYFAALGAIEFGRDEETHVGRYLRHARRWRTTSTSGRDAEKAASGARGPQRVGRRAARVSSSAYTPKPFTPATFAAGEVVRAFVGVDGGSTSTKAVLLSEDGDVLSKAYQLSKGNPIQDTIEMFDELRAPGRVSGRDARGARRRHDRLREGHPARRAPGRRGAGRDRRAHASRRSRFYKDPHVIVDVGGQDIKLIVLKDGRVKDFKLNTQCSAGNGYFLQSTAEGVRHPRRGNSPTRRSPRRRCRSSATAAPCSCSPTSSTSSARAGRRRRSSPASRRCCRRTSFSTWRAFRIWRKLGTRFVLQGGTQHNLAAVKAEVDFIRSNFRGAGHASRRSSSTSTAASRARSARRRGDAALQPRASDDVHRPRCRAEDHLSHDAQRGDALQLLQEQLPADVHRRQDAEPARQVATATTLPTIGAVPEIGAAAREVRKCPDGARPSGPATA